MDLGQKELRLNDAGFSQKEIADWKKQKIQKLNNAGFNNQEVLEAFGTTTNDKKIYQDYFSDIKKQIVDEYESQEIVSPEDEMLYKSRIEQGDPVSLKEFSATLEEAVIDFQKQEGKFKTMISTPLNVEQAHNFIKTFCLSPTKIDPNNYSKPMYNKLLSSYEKEEKLSGNTVYTLYNALTRWGTHAETKGQQHTVERHRNARIAQALRSKEWKELGQLKLIEY